MGRQGNWERFAPLTGIVFVAIVVAVFAIGGSTPGDHDSAQKVQAFYAAHHTKHMNLAFIMMIAIPFVLFFASVLRHDLRRAGGSGQLANAAFGGGVLLSAGLGLLAAVHLALADAGGNAKTIATAQTLNVLDNNDFVLMVAGLAVLALAGGLSALRHGGLPKWMGWAGIVIGVLSFTPVGFIAFLAAGIWVVIAAILLTLARRQIGEAPAPPSSESYRAAPAG
jgi:hypothetical protein